MGCCAGPDDVYQVLRGLRTMGVRQAASFVSASFNGAGATVIAFSGRNRGADWRA